MLTMKVALVYLEPITYEPMGLLYVGTALTCAGRDAWAAGAKNDPRVGVTLAGELQADWPGLLGIPATPYRRNGDSAVRDQLKLRGDVLLTRRWPGNGGAAHDSTGVLQAATA